MSWNGATEVARWRFWGNINNQSGFSEIGDVEKAGFETRSAAEEHSPFTFVEGLTSDGRSLANSSTVSVERLSADGGTIDPSSSPLPYSTSASPTASPTASQSGDAVSPLQTGAAVRKGREVASLFMAVGLGGVAMIFMTF